MNALSSWPAFPEFSEVMCHTAWFQNDSSTPRYSGALGMGY